MANKSLSLAYLLCVSICANHVLWYTMELIYGVRQHTQYVYVHTMCHSTMHMVHGVHTQIHLVHKVRGMSSTQISNKIFLYSVGTQQIIYYQSIILATCFGSLSHHQTNSQTILKVHSVDVHSVGSQMFANRMTIKGTNDCQQPVHHENSVNMLQ